MSSIIDTTEAERRIAGRINPETTNGMGMIAMTGGASLVPESMGQALELAKMMAISQLGIRKHLRGNPGACAAVLFQALRWGMDPFSVANKSYEVNDQIAYESQLITAVLNTRAPIKGRLRYAFEGEGTNRRCTASAVLQEDGDTVEVQSPRIADIEPKRSPLWKNDPDQQLCYYTARSLARRYFPEVLLGVYAEDDPEPVAEGRLASNGRVVDAAPEPPKRSDFQKPADTESLIPVFDPYGDHVGDFTRKGVAEQIETMAGTARPHDVLALIEYNDAGISMLLPDQRRYLKGLGHDAQAAIEKENYARDGRYFEAQQKQKADQAAAKQAETVDPDTGEVSDGPAEDGPLADGTEPDQPAAPDSDERPVTDDDIADAMIQNLNKLASDPVHVGGYWQDVSDDLKAMEGRGPDGVAAAKRVRTRYQQITSGALV